MEIKISDKIMEKYPELEVGVVVARGIDNSNYNDEIQQMIREIEKLTREKIDAEKVTEIPIIAKWREIYKDFGAKPSKYRNSVEALIKRVLKTELYKINPLVDIYNYISIKHIMTVGGEDTNQIEGNLVLDFANGDEEFIPLGEDENQPPWEGEVVYKDDKGVICRCWNYREADRTKLTKDTKNAVVVIENLLPENSDKLKQALDELKELIEKYCGGECEISILNKDSPSKQIKQ
jgi:lysyl-tRNA synthetase class 2